MIEIDLDDSRFDGIMDKVRAVNDDPKPALQIMSVLALQAIDRKFRQEGPGWTKLTPRYEARKRKLGKDGPILHFNGTLKAAMVDPTESLGGIFRMEDDGQATTLTMGTNLVYAATHQWGRGPIPARPFLPGVDELIDPFKQALTGYIKEHTK